MTTYTPSLRLAEPVPGDPAVKNQWGTILNENQVLIESAITDTVQVAIGGLTSYTLTVANGAADQARPLVQEYTGALTGACTVTLPNVPKAGYAQNSTTGGLNVILTAGAGATATIPPDGAHYLFFADGAANVQLIPIGFGAVNIVGSATVARSLTVIDGVDIAGGSLTVGCSVSATNVITTTSGGADVNGPSIFRSGGVTLITTNTLVPLQTFQFNTTPVGSIATNGTSTSFNTTSDERLKTLDGAITESGAIIDKLRAVWFRWKSAEDAKPEPGFVAQQVAKVFPWAVTKGKGRCGTENFQPWQMDAAKLMPVVIAELQSLRRRVAELEKAR